MKPALLQHESSLWWPFFSGVLLVLTLPYIGGSPLAWVALVPFILFATNTAISTSRLLYGTLLMGLTYALGVVYPVMDISGWWWAGASGMTETLIGHFLYFGGILLLALYSALWFIIVAILLRRFGISTVASLLPLCAWGIVEWLRVTYGLFGFSAGTLGYTLIDTRYLKYLAAVPHIGVYALSVLVFSGNIALAELLRFYRARAGGMWERLTNVLRIYFAEPMEHVSFWTFMLLFLGAGVFGMIFDAQAESPSATPIRVAVIATTISTTASISEGAYRDMRLKLEHAYASGAALIVLPENSFPYFEINESQGTLIENSFIRFADRDALYADFVALSRAHASTTLVVGLHTLGADRKHYNSAVVYKDGIPVAYYHKRKLVPFTEYAPLSLRIPIVVRFAAGQVEQYFDIEGIRATALICSEIEDTTLPLSAAALIISPSNDSIFPGGQHAIDAHQASKMRAIETGAYVLRSSKGGISSIITPKGEVIASGNDGVLVGDILIGK